MAKSRSTTLLVTTVDATGVTPARRRPDELVVEEPLTIQLNDVTVATTMRTPGHDFELAVGFCHAEGLLGGAPVTSVRYCATAAASATEFNVVTVTAPGAPPPVARIGTTTSSCGLCGSEAIDNYAARLSPLPPAALPPMAILAGMAEAVRPIQALFGTTGAVHAAASFGAAGNVVLVREDVGRHNAVDKLVGRMLLDGQLPAGEMGLFVSGRASFELVAKAWAAGFAWMVSVSAPTELAVLTARRAGLVLAGFGRGTSLNVYAPERLTGS